MLSSRHLVEYAMNVMFNVIISISGVILRQQQVLSDLMVDIIYNTCRSIRIMTASHLRVVQPFILVWFQQ